MSTNNKVDLLYECFNARNILFSNLFGVIPDYTYPSVYKAPHSVETSNQITSAKDIAAIIGKQINQNKIAILVYKPTQERPYWIYLTSGLSNPWFSNERDIVSGFGLELVVKTKEESKWAGVLLRRLSYYILSYAGTLSPGVSLRFGKPLRSGKKNSDESAGKADAVLIWYADEAPDTVYSLPSGEFGIFSVLTLTADECDFVEKTGEYGPWCIQELFRQQGISQISDLNRSSIMLNPTTTTSLDKLQAYCLQFSAK